MAREFKHEKVVEVLAKQYRKYDAVLRQPKMASDHEKALAARAALSQTMLALNIVEDCRAWLTAHPS